MASKIKVYGKAQNRTALGVAHAYVVINPQATLEDLRKAFPNSLCPDKGVAENFLPVEEAEKFNEKMGLYFTKPDEVIELQDGSKVALCQVWSKPSFDRMVEQGKLYDIEVAEFEKTMKGEKGGYRLEYLNGYVPPVPVVVEKKKSKVWLWILLLLLIAAGVIAYLLTRQPKVVEVEKIVEIEKEVVVRDTVVNEVIVRDTIFVQQVEEIEKNFNAAQFAKGKADLTDDSKIALHDLAQVMKQNPELRLRIEGHTSVEGDAAVNQKLSEARAQAAVEFLVNKEGIDASRLEAVGKGSSELKDPENPTSDVNRRTEFEIL